MKKREEKSVTQAKKNVSSEREKSAKQRSNSNEQASRLSHSLNAKADNTQPAVKH